MRVLRLFVWEEFEPSYADGLAFAIAESHEAARRMIAENSDLDAIKWGPVKSYPVTVPVCFAVAGGD